MDLINIANYTTNDSKNKIVSYDTNVYKLPKGIMLDNILETMLDRFGTKYNISHNTNTNHTLKSIKNMFSDFDSRFNNNSHINSSFKNEIMSMDKLLCINLASTYGNINIYILFDSTKTNISLIVSILHAINMFCHMFPYVNYDGLDIYICLDECKRKLITSHSKSIKSDIREMQQKSMGMCVSGITNRYDRVIMLTKKEEIIKLLFHEMAHFAELDEKLVNTSYANVWSADKTILNLSEAYTEFVSVILACAYYSIHLGIVNKLDIYKLYQSMIEAEYNYSIMLSKSILNFYNVSDPIHFFNGSGPKLYCPICIWEYVIGRTVLFTNIDKLTPIIKSNLKIESNHVQQIINIFDNSQLLAPLIKNLPNKIVDTNISFMLVELVF